MTFHLLICSVDCIFGVIAKKSLPIFRSQDFYYFLLGVFLTMIYSELFLYLLDVWIKVKFFEYGHPTVRALFVENSILSPWNCFYTFANVGEKTAISFSHSLLGSQLWHLY